MRLHKYQAIHAIGHVHAHWGGGAVIDIQPRVERSEGELRAMAGGGQGGSRAPSRAGHGMQINVVRHFALRMIVQVQFHHIPLFDADEFPRHAATKGPERIIHALGEALHHFAYFQIDDNFGGMVACEGWGHQGCIRQHRDLLPRDLRMHGWCLIRLGALGCGGGVHAHQPYQKDKPKT